MPRELLIVVTETNYGFRAVVPGAQYRGAFGATIPAALRALGTSIVGVKEYLREIGKGGSYADVFKWLSAEKPETGTGTRETQ